MGADRVCVTMIDFGFETFVDAITKNDSYKALLHQFKILDIVAMGSNLTCRGCLLSTLCPAVAVGLPLARH